MDKLEYVIFYFVMLIVVFLIHYFIVFKYRYKRIDKNKSKKKKKIESFIGFSYLVPRFKLDMNRVDLNYMFVMISLVNSIIITSVSEFIMFIPWPIAYQMLLGFVLLFGLIYSLYELCGRVLIKKGWSTLKNESKGN